MSSLMSYLRQEGLTATIKKAVKKVQKGKSSSTIFLKFDSAGVENNPAEDMEFRKLSQSTQKDFEKIKFWEFVISEDYIENPNQCVIMLWQDGKPIGYAAEQHEVMRVIHGTGRFRLSDGEGWIGPVYVARGYRGKGYNQALLREQVRGLTQKDIFAFYTAINSENTASLISFKKVGFEQIGEIDGQGAIISDRTGILAEKFQWETK